MAYSVIEQASGFNVNDDNEYPVKLVEDILVAVNNSLIREAYKQGKIDQLLYMEHEGMTIKPVEKQLTYNDIPVDVNQHLSYVDLPLLITGIGNKNLMYFGTADYSINFSNKRFEKLINQKGVRYHLHNVSFSVVGNRAYFLASEVQGVKFVSAIGIWSDPRTVSSYNAEEAFPTTSDYKMELLALQQLLSGKNIPFDIINDGQRVFAQPRQEASK